MSQTPHHCGTGNMYLHCETNGRHVAQTLQDGAEIIVHSIMFKWPASAYHHHLLPTPPTHTTTATYIKNLLQDVDMHPSCLGHEFSKYLNSQFALLISVNHYLEIKHTKTWTFTGIGILLLVNTGILVIARNALPSDSSLRGRDLGFPPLGCTGLGVGELFCKCRQNAQII